jgi:lipopolysaccharide transport system ATP-binding protein
MEKQTAVKVEDVSKKYALGQRGYHTLREDIYRLFSPKRKEQDNSDFYALKNISFQLKKGEILGIIGPNGAGKSTILKLLSRITLPTAGRIYKEGRVAAMIELAAGFHPELTGRENIYLYGSIMGMKNKEIDKRFKQIVDFSELEEFLDTPLKRYSSGMKARLGFSVSAHVDADILLIDEVLSVGDMSFQGKCLKRMEDYINNETSIIFVSHNLDSIRKLCRRTILLDEGRILIDGPTEEAINKYFGVVSEKAKEDIFIKDENGQNKRFAEITDIKLLNDERKPTSHFNSGDEAIFKYIAIFNGDVEKANFGFFIRRDDRLIVFDTSQFGLEKRFTMGKTGTTIGVEFKFRVELLKGIYHIGTYIYDSNRKVRHDYIDKAATLFVNDDISYAGVANLHPEFRIKKIERRDIVNDSKAI